MSAEFRIVFINEDAPAPSARAGDLSRARADAFRGQGTGGSAVEWPGSRPRETVDVLSRGSSKEKGPLDEFDKLALRLNDLPVLNRIATSGEAIVRPLLATHAAIGALQAHLNRQTSVISKASDTRLDISSRTTPILAELVRQTPPPLPTRPEPITYDILNAVRRQATPPPLPPVVRQSATPPAIPVQPGAAAAARTPVVAADATAPAAAGGVASLGPAAVGAALAVGSLAITAGGVSSALRALRDHANESANTLATYSGLLAAARAREEAAQTFQNVRRADYLGTDLARYSSAQARTDRALERIADVLTKEGLQRLVPVLEDLAKFGERGADFAEKYGKQAADAAIATLRNQFPKAALLIDLVGAIAKNTEKAADAAAGGDDGFMEIFARPAPLKPDGAGDPADNIERKPFAANALGPQLRMK